MFTWLTTTKNPGGLDALIARCKNPQAALKEVGRRGSNELKKWFRARNKTPNKLGGRRSNLWLKIADSVQQPALIGTTRVRISVTHPVIMQKVKGGTIKAKRGKYLTLPRVPEAYDRTVAVFKKETGITLTFIKPGSVALMVQLLGKGKFRVVYVLKTSVDQEKDPNALPTQAAWNAALLDQAQKSLDRQNRPPSTP